MSSLSALIFRFTILNYSKINQNFRGQRLALLRALFNHPQARKIMLKKKEKFSGTNTISRLSIHARRINLTIYLMRNRISSALVSSIILKTFKRNTIFIYKEIKRTWLWIMLNLKSQQSFLKTLAFLNRRWIMQSQWMTCIRHQPTILIDLKENYNSNHSNCLRLDLTHRLMNT